MDLLFMFFHTKDGRQVEIRESDDHTLELKILKQIIARFTPTGVTIENTLKEVATNDRRPGN